MVRIVYARQVNGRLRQIKPVRRAARRQTENPQVGRLHSRRCGCHGLRRGQLSMLFA